MIIDTRSSFGNVECTAIQDLAWSTVANAQFCPTTFRDALNSVVGAYARDHYIHLESISGFLSTSIVTGANDMLKCALFCSVSSQENIQPCHATGRCFHL